MKVARVEGENHNAIAAGVLLRNSDNFRAANAAGLLGGGLVTAYLAIEDDVTFAETEAKHRQPERDDGDHREGKSGT